MHFASFINTSDKYLNPRPPLYIIPNKRVIAKRENSVYRFTNRSRNQGGHRPLGGLSEADPQHKSTSFHMATRIMRRIERKCVQIGKIEPKSSATCGAAGKELRGENVIARVPAASSGYKQPLSCPRGGRRATNCGARRAAGLKIIAACTRRARETRCSALELSGHHSVRKPRSSRHSTSAGTESTMSESTSEDLRSAKTPESTRYHFFSRKNLIRLCSFQTFAKTLQLTKL
jgi:hypothetical protein